MTVLCQPLPESAIQDFLRDAVRALCDRPVETQAQREERAHRLVHTTLGFRPRDGLEYMLATLAQGHYDLILNLLRDALHARIDTAKLQTTRGIIGLARSFRGLVADHRRAAARPLAEEARREAEANRAEPNRQAARAKAPDAVPAPNLTPETPAVGSPVFDTPAPAFDTPVSAPREVATNAVNPAARTSLAASPVEADTPPTDNLVVLRAAWAEVLNTLEEIQAHDAAQERAVAAAGNWDGELERLA